MAVVTFVALVIHVAYPLAPPRMMPGFVDTMFRYGPSIYTRNTLEGAANQIAAMPSLHFGWAVIAAMAVVQVNRSRWRYVAVLHPFLMGTAIVATANHWWVDAAAAGLIIFFCWAVAKVVSRLLTARERDWEDGAPTPGAARSVPRPTSAAERRAVEAVDGGERRNRRPAQTRRLVLGPADEDRRREGVIGRKPEERRRRRFDARQERRHHAAEPARPRRQQDAPAERIDGGAAGDRRPFELAVHQRDATEIGGDGEHHRDVLDAIEQLVRMSGGDT